MAKWTGEVSIRRMGKSYYITPPTFVTVEAGNYAAATGAAIREAKKRLKAKGGKPVIVESVLVKLTRVRESKPKGADIYERNAPPDDADEQHAPLRLGPSRYFSD